MSDSIKKLLKPVASLYLTVALLAVSMLLIYAGTTVQKQMSIQDVQRDYFHSWFVRVPLDPMLRPFAAAGSEGSGAGFWMVGGYSLIFLLLANLLAAHSVRFKLSWKRSGIIAIHLGLILMLVGEISATATSAESQMMIDQGQTANYTYDVRNTELVVIDPSAPDHDQVTAIDASALTPGATVQPASLPFSIHVEGYFPNSMILGPMQQSASAVKKATAGANQALQVQPAPKISGIKADRSDQASTFLTLSAGGKNLGTYLVSQFSHPETVDVDGKQYRMELRFRRYYKPYSITLLKFSHDTYAGTKMASNFSSRVRLVDPSRHVDREVLIWMNHPLTYEGETFYQQSFLPGDQTTILQVTHNPGWILPYGGLALGLIGMLVHFGMHLRGFLRRRAAAIVAEQTSRSAPPKRRSGAPMSAGDVLVSGYVLEPHRNGAAWVTGLLCAALVTMMVIGVMASPAAQEAGFDLGAYGALPVMSGGRVMPLDSLARNTLKVISGRETFKDAQGKPHPAIRWLADTMSDVPGAADYKVLRIDYQDILSQLGLDPAQKFFSINDLLAHREVVQKQFEMAMQVPEDSRDLYQKRLVELAEHVEEYLQIQQAGRLMLVPPAQEGGEWPTLMTQSGANPAGERFISIIQKYHDGQTREFNDAVAQYHAGLQQQLPRTMAKVDFEAFFNHVAPFYLSLWFYVLVFVMACGSWLFFRKPLWAGAMGVLLATTALHTFGLISRIYLTDRPPVTNLYASAIFIGWAVVLMAIVLEVIYRNGIGAAIASVIGFASLLIAHYLGNDGDTMKPVIAVLATNFWLWTHVPCVTLGYASTFLSGMLAVAYVLLGLFTRVLDEPRRRALARMVYGITCFAILFSFVGTILGGIWADYSWGRFWGWDPKENGAILIVLWNAIILHARWGGIVKERGMMLLAIFGNVVTAWSWFGTNMLGIGLHAYGFMESAAVTLFLFALLQVALIGIGLIPTSMWRGLRTVGAKPERVAALTA